MNKQITASLFLLTVMISIVLSAWWLSSYDSIYAMSQVTAMTQSGSKQLDSQYREMKIAFELGNYSYTYSYGSLLITIKNDQVDWNNPKECKQLVLKEYSAMIYNVQYRGDLGRLNAIAGAGAHTLYTIALILMLIIYGYLCYLARDEITQMLAKIILPACLCSIILFLLFSSYFVGQWKPGDPLYADSLPLVVGTIQTSLIGSNLILSSIGIGASLYEKYKKHKVELQEKMNEYAKKYNRA